MDTFFENLKEYIYFLSIPKMSIVDLLEILLIAFAIYRRTKRTGIGLWRMNTPDCVKNI